MVEADPDTNYISNKAIGGRYFNGETVPGDNSVQSDNNLYLKKAVDNYINSQVLQRTEDGNATDVAGTLATLADTLYGQARSGDKLFIEKRERRRAKKSIKGPNFGIGDTRKHGRGEET